MEVDKALIKIPEFEEAIFQTVLSIVAIIAY